MRVVTGVAGVMAIILLLMKKTKAISLGAFLAVVLIVSALVVSVVVQGISDGGGPGLLIILLMGLIASFAVLFRFRGSFPVLGKFT